MQNSHLETKKDLIERKIDTSKTLIRNSNSFLGGGYHDSRAVTMNYGNHVSGEVARKIRQGTTCEPFSFFGALLSMSITVVRPREYALHLPESVRCGLSLRVLGALFRGSKVIQCCHQENNYGHQRGITFGVIIGLWIER